MAEFLNPYVELESRGLVPPKSGYVSYATWRLMTSNNYVPKSGGTGRSGPVVKYAARHLGIREGDIQRRMGLSVFLAGRLSAGDGTGCPFCGTEVPTDIFATGERRVTRRAYAVVGADDGTGCLTREGRCVNETNR